MANKINLSQFKQEKIYKTIEFGENVVEIYNPTDEQRGKILDLSTKVGNEITNNDMIIELIKMLTNINVGKNPEEIIKNPNETLMDIIELLTDILSNISSRYLKMGGRLLKQDKIYNEFVPQEIKDKLDKISEIENKIVNE